MKLEEKLQLLRKQNGYSQEQLADINKMVKFLIRAKRNSYAGKGSEVKASRTTVSRTGDLYKRRLLLSLQGRWRIELVSGL